MSTALRASLVVLIFLALFSFLNPAFAEVNPDEADDMCPLATATNVYRSDRPKLAEFEENGKKFFNLYGTICKDIEGKQVAANGICVEARVCRAAFCGGKPCALPTVPPPSISDAGDVTGGQPPATQTQQPTPTNRSLLEQMMFDSTPLSQQKTELSPSANSVGELLKQIDANPGLGGKVREEIGSFFSPTPLNPNQQSFQLQPRDQNGNLISQDVGPQNTMTNSDSTFAGNQEQETSQTSACDSWWSCMQERVSSAYGEALEEAAQKTTRKPFSALVPDGKGGYYLPSDARLTEAQGPPSRADADRVTGLDGPAEFKATFYTAQGTGSGEKFNGSGFASSLYPIGTAGTMEFLDKDGNVVATRQMYVNDWGNLGPGVGADLPRSTVAEVQVETGIKYVRDGVFDVRFTPEAVIQGKVAGDGWYADTAAAKAANSYVQARTGGYSPSDALAAVEQNTGAYAAYQPSDNTATPQTNVASNADVPLPRDNPFRSGGNIASVANTDLPSSAAITQQFLNDTNTRSIALAGEPANVASSQSPQFAAVEPPETNQVTGATVRVGENTAQVNPDGSVKVTINTANETSYVKTIPADVAQALTFTEMVQSVQNQVADMPKDQDRVISNPLVFVPDAQPEVSVTPEIAPPPPVGGVNTPDVPVASVEVPKVDTPQIPEAQIRERIAQSIPLDQYDKMTPLSQQLARDSAVQGIEFDQRTAQLAEERRLASPEPPAPAAPAPSALTTLSNAANAVADAGKSIWNWGSEKVASLFGTTPEPEAPTFAEVPADEPQPSATREVPTVTFEAPQTVEAPSPEIQAAERAQLEARLAQADQETAAYQQRLEQGIQDIERQTQSIALTPEEIQKSLDAESERLREIAKAEEAKRIADASGAPVSETAEEQRAAAEEQRKKIADAEALRIAARENADNLSQQERETRAKAAEAQRVADEKKQELAEANKLAADVQKVRSSLNSALALKAKAEGMGATVAALVPANAAVDQLGAVITNAQALAKNPLLDAEDRASINTQIAQVQSYKAGLTAAIANLDAGGLALADNAAVAARGIIATGQAPITGEDSPAVLQKEYTSLQSAATALRGEATSVGWDAHEARMTASRADQYARGVQAEATQVAAVTVPDQAVGKWEPPVVRTVAASDLPVPEFSAVPGVPPTEQTIVVQAEVPKVDAPEAPVVTPQPAAEIPLATGVPADRVSFKSETVSKQEEVILNKLGEQYTALQNMRDTWGEEAIDRGVAACASAPSGRSCRTYQSYNIGVQTEQAKYDQIWKNYNDLQAYKRGGELSPNLQQALGTMEKGQGPTSATFDAYAKPYLQAAGNWWTPISESYQKGDWGGVALESWRAVPAAGNLIWGGLAEETKIVAERFAPESLGFNPTTLEAARCGAVGQTTCTIEAVGHGVNVIGAAWIAKDLAQVTPKLLSLPGRFSESVFPRAGSELAQVADVPAVAVAEARLPGVRVGEVGDNLPVTNIVAPRNPSEIGIEAVGRELAGDAGAARPVPPTAELQQTIDRIAVETRAAASERPAVPPTEAPPTVSPEVQKIQDAIAEVRAASERSPIIPSEVPPPAAGVTPSPILSSEERLANALADINRGVRPLETPTSVPGVIPTNTQLPGVKIQQWADDFAVPGRVVNDDIALIDAQAARASAQPAPRVAPEAERIGAATTQQAPRDITNQGLQNLERDLARAVDDVNIASRSEPNVGVKALEDVAANINAGLPTNVSPQVKALDDLVKTLETGAQEVRAGNAEVWSSERLAALRQNADLVAQKGQQELADRMRNAADGLAGEVRPLKQIPGSNTIFDVPLEQKSFFSRTGDNIQLAWNDLKNSASDAWSNLWGRTVNETPTAAPVVERLTPGEPVPSGSTNLDNFYLNPKTGRYEQVPEPPAATVPESVPTVRTAANEVGPSRPLVVEETAVPPSAGVAQRPLNPADIVETRQNPVTGVFEVEPKVVPEPRNTGTAAAQPEAAPLSREQLEVLTGIKFTEAEFNALIPPTAAEQPSWLQSVGSWVAENPKKTIAGGVVAALPIAHFTFKDGSGGTPPPVVIPPPGAGTPPPVVPVVPPKDPPVVVPPPEKKAPPYVPPVVTRGPSDINVPEGGQTPGQGGGGLGGMLSGLIGALSKLFGGSQAPQTTPTTPPTTQPTNPPVVTPTPPKPYVTLIANPTSLLSGRKSLLTWSSVNTSSCELFAPGDISMATGTRGSTSTLALATTTRFVLDCSAPSGATTSAQAIVTVQ